MCNPQENNSPLMSCAERVVPGKGQQPSFVCLVQTWAGVAESFVGEEANAGKLFTGTVAGFSCWDQAGRLMTLT